MATRHRKTRRRLRSKRAHSRKGSRRQRGGSGSTLGDLVAVLREKSVKLADIKYILAIRLPYAHGYNGHNALILNENINDLYYISDEELDAAEINGALEIDDEYIRIFLNEMREHLRGNFWAPRLNVEELFQRVKTRALKKAAHNTTALQYVAKAPQNGSRAANVLLHPQLSGLIGEQLSGKKGSLPSQVNKLKQNIGIPGVPRA
jgi:hypothetical protein